jgi:hypothetical protein
MDVRTYSPIYDVTQGLRMLIHSQLLLIAGNAMVTLRPPGGALPASPGVNLYLYRVTESPAARNQAWRGDRQTPAGTAPALSLVLSYLLTPFAPELEDANAATGDDAHKYLGVAMKTLHENPVLTRTHIPGFDADAVLPDYFRDSYETLGIALQQLTIDELSKIAAPTTHPFRLSVAYEVSLVQLVPSRAAAVRGGIVLAPVTTVFTLERPAISALTPASGALARMVAGAIVANEIEAAGSGFGTPSATTTAYVGSAAASVTRDTSTPETAATAATIVLPDTLSAGPSVDVQIVVDGTRSIPFPFTVDPWLATATPVRTALDPTLAADGELVLRGSGWTAGAQVRFDDAGGPQSVVATEAGGDLHAAIPTTLTNGLHEVRVVLANAKVSNSRTLEVIPWIDEVRADVTGDVHTLTIDGARLVGADIGRSDVRMRLDGSEHAVAVDATNASAARLVIPLGRKLAAGTHTLSLQIDGSQSRAVAFDVSP